MQFSHTVVAPHFQRKMRVKLLKNLPVMELVPRAFYFLSYCIQEAVKNIASNNNKIKQVPFVF